MNTDHLRYLIAIGKTKSMSQASESLFITPQALSMAIKKLESELALPLLKRSSSGTELTENGQWLVQLSTQFFADIANHQEQYQNYLNNISAKPSGTLDILLNASGISDSQLAQIICTISTEEPDLHINLRETSRDEVEKAVSNGSIELGFIYRTKYNKKYIDDLDESLRFYPLQKGSMIILANEKFPFAKFESTFLKTVVDYPICYFDAINAFADDNRAQNFLQLVTSKPVKHYTIVNNYSLYKASIMQGNAISVSVNFGDKHHILNYIEEVNAIHVRDDVQIFFGILCRKDESMSANASFLWHKILEIYQPF